MSRETTLKRILDGGVVAVVRSESSASLVKVVQALAEGGVTAAEITFTVPDAVDLTTAEAFLKAGACCLGGGLAARLWSPRRSPPATSPAFASLLASMPRSWPEFATPGDFLPL